jgi:hypothetical protein
VGWRLLVWLVRGRNPWREPPAGRGGGEPIRTMSGAATRGNEADAVVPPSCLKQR